MSCSTATEEEEEQREHSPMVCINISEDTKTEFEKIWEKCGELETAIQEIRGNMKMIQALLMNKVKMILLDYVTLCSIKL